MHTLRYKYLLKCRVHITKACPAHVLHVAAFHARRQSHAGLYLNATRVTPQAFAEATLLHRRHDQRAGTHHPHNSLSAPTGATGNLWHCLLFALSPTWRPLQPHN